MKIPTKPGEMKYVKRKVHTDGASVKGYFSTGIQVAGGNYQYVVPNCETQTEN